MSDKYDAAIRLYSDTYNVDFAMIKAIIRAESGFRPKVQSKAGCHGLMQLAPSTYAEMRYGNSWKSKMGDKSKLVSGLQNPNINIKYGTKYYAYLLGLYKGNKVLALASYNWGQGNVSRICKEVGKQYSDIVWDDIKAKLPNETRNYVPRVSKYYVDYGGTSILYTNNNPIAPNSVLPSKVPEAGDKEFVTPTTANEDEIPINSAYGEVTDPDFFKLGDVVLRVPPQAINIQETNATYTFPTVRTKGSPKLKTGEANINITVDCTFPSLRDINGYWDGGLWYGGLRSIVAQYYCAPFLPLENPTIRKIVLPTPDIPEDKPWKPTLNLSKLLSEAGDILQGVLAEVQENTKVDNSTLQNYLTKQITLTKERKKIAEDEYRKAMARQEVEEGSKSWEGVIDTPSNIYDDATIAVVLDTFNISTVPGFPRRLNAKFTLMPFNYTPFSDSFGFVSTEFDATTQAEEFNNIIYNPLAKITGVQPTYDISESRPFLKYYRALLTEFQDGDYHKVYPLRSGTNSLDRMEGNADEDITISYSYTTETRLGILQKEAAAAKASLVALKVASATKKAGDPPNWFFERWYRLISAGLSTITSFPSQIKPLIKQGLGVDDADTLIYDPLDMRITEAVAYLKKYIGEDKYEAFIELFEGITDAILATQDVEPFITQTIHLGGPNAAVAGISASYSNKVAPIKLTGQDYPTYQYMGGSDVSFSITMQTADEDLLSALRLLSINTNYTQLLKATMSGDNMADAADTSATVDGEFFRLLGVRNVIITNVNYSTTEGYPGLYTAEINCVQADMDMKKYEALVGGHIIDSKILKYTIDLLTNDSIDGSTKWDVDSIWNTYSAELLLIKDEVDNLEKDIKSRGESYDSAVQDMIDLSMRTGEKGISIWGRFKRALSSSGIAADAQEERILDRGAARLMEKVREGREEARQFISLFAVKQNIISALSNPTILAELHDDELQSMIADRKDKYSEIGEGNECYSDLGLPSLTGSALDTPADFFYRRTDLITSDAISEELAVLEQYEKTRVETAFMINFENAEDEWEYIDDQMGNVKQVLEKIKEGIPYPNMNALRQEFAPLKADKPQHMIDTIKNIYAAAQVKSLEKRLAGMSASRQELLDGLNKGDHGANKSRRVDTLMARYDAEITNLEKMLANRRGPNGMILDNTSSAGILTATGEYGWWGNAEAFVDSQYIKTNALESRKLDQTLQMARAYPAFKLYFIEEDKEEWLLFDDLYSYSAVKSIDIIKSRKAASDTAIIRVSNIMGNLTNPLADYGIEHAIAGGTAEEQSMDKMMLRVGCPIMIRLGYNNDPMKLPMQFHGAIVELKPGEGEIELVAQGWGAQLNTPVSANGDHVNWWGTEKAHGDVATWALDRVPGMDHLGKKSIFDKNNDALRRDPGDTLFAGLVNIITGMDMGDNNPRDDNIYFPYNTSWMPFTNPTFDWKVDPGQTAWEVINELLLWYPDWIATVLPYTPDPSRMSDERLTLYVGPQDGFYKWTDAYDEDWTEYQNDVRGISSGSNPPVEIGAGSSEYTIDVKWDWRKSSKDELLKVFNKSVDEMGPTALQYDESDVAGLKADLAAIGVTSFEDFLEWSKMHFKYVIDSPKDSKDLGGRNNSGMRSISKMIRYARRSMSYTKEVIDLHRGQFYDAGHGFGHSEYKQYPKYIFGDCEDLAHFIVKMSEEYGFDAYYSVLYWENSNGTVSGHAVSVIKSNYCVYSTIDNKYVQFAYDQTSANTIKELYDKGSMLKGSHDVRPGYAVFDLAGRIFLPTIATTAADATKKTFGERLSNKLIYLCMLNNDYNKISTELLMDNLQFKRIHIDDMSTEGWFTDGEVDNPVGSVPPDFEHWYDKYGWTEIKKRWAMMTGELPPYPEKGLILPDTGMPPKLINPARRDAFFHNGRLLRCFKPVVNHHWYDSDHHIIDNQITASVDNMYNRVILSYPGGKISEPVYSREGGKFTGQYEMAADDNLNPDYIRTYLSYQKNIDTNWWANMYMPMIAGWDYRHGNIDEAKFLGMIPQQIKVANTVLANQVREMYTGTVTVVGDPSVKPWDKMYIYDFENGIYGPAQVEQVIHHFSAEGGYTTTITPDLIVHNQNYSNTINTTYFNHIFLWAAVKGFIAPFTGVISPFTVGSGARYLKSAKWSTAVWTKTLGKFVGKQAATQAGKNVAAAIPYVGWGIWIAWTLHDIVKGAGLTFEAELGKLFGREPISITPINYYGLPLLAGLEGMRTDDIWTHTDDSISAIKDIPRNLLSHIGR